MIRIMLIRVLTIFLVVYCIYYLGQLLSRSHVFSFPKKSLKDVESTEYDKEEWEKIKKSLKE